MGPFSTPAVSTHGVATPVSKPGFTNSCVAAAELMVRLRVAVCDVAPDVPVMVTEDVPTVAVADAVNVSTEVALPFAGGVTGLADNAAVTPVGRPEALNAVAELKPLRLATVIVVVPFVPCFTVSDVGESETVKSGTPTATPVPVRLAVCVPLGALSVTVIVPVRAPATVGVNVTLMVQFAPAAKDAPQVFVCA